MTARTAALRELDFMGHLELADRVRDGVHANDLLKWEPHSAVQRVLMVLEGIERGGMKDIR